MCLCLCVPLPVPPATAIRSASKVLESQPGWVACLRDQPPVCDAACIHTVSKLSAEGGSRRLCKVTEWRSVLCACRKDTPRDVSAQFKEDSKASGTPVQPVKPVPAKSTGKAVMKAIDGNEATANIAYAFNDVSFIYPITPATPMGEAVDQWSNEGRINLNNNVMEVSAGASLAYITQFASLARHA